MGYLGGEYEEQENRQNSQNIEGNPEIGDVSEVHDPQNIQNNGEDAQKVENKKIVESLKKIGHDIMLIAEELEAKNGADDDIESRMNLLGDAYNKVKALISKNKKK